MSGVVPSHSSRESHTSTFFMPRHEILVVGTYSVTFFCHSVFIHFPIIISTTVAHIQLNLIDGCVM